MREVNLTDLPEANLSTLDDSPKEVGLSEVPEVDLSSLDSQPSPQAVFGPVVTPHSGGATGTWAPETPHGASGGWTPTPAVDHTKELQALLSAARTDGVTRPAPAPDAAAVNVLPESQRKTAAKSAGPFMPETQGPLYDPTASEIAKEQGKGFVRGLTAGSLGGPPVPGEEGTLGDIVGAGVTNLVPYLAGPQAGMAVNGYYAYLRDLNEQADQGKTLPEMNQKRALARAAVAMAFAKVPGALGAEPLVKGVTGAAIGSAGNVADVMATQLADSGRIDFTDPEYAEQYKSAALMGAALGGPVGALSPSHGQPHGRKMPEEHAPLPDAAAIPAQEVPLSALPESDFPDHAVEAAFDAQHTASPAAEANAVSTPAKIPDTTPEIALSQLPEGGGSHVQEEGGQGREALQAPLSLTPDYQRFAVRIARLHPKMTEDQAMHQAWVLQQMDNEARARGSGDAVNRRAIEFDQTGDPLRKPPADAPDVLHVGAAVAQSLSDDRGVLRVNPMDIPRLGLQKGESLNPTPMNAREMWRVMGRPVKIDPNAPTLEHLAERMNEGMAVHDEGVVSYRPKENQKILGADLPNPDHGYHADDLAVALRDRPRHQSAVEDQIHAAQSAPKDVYPGQDERYLHGMDPEILNPAPRFDKYGELPPPGQPDTFLGADGEPLFQHGAQRDMFGGESQAPKAKPKVEQTDMFGERGRVAGQGEKGRADKGLEGTELQKRSDEAAQNQGQEKLLQEGGFQPPMLKKEDLSARPAEVRSHDSNGRLTMAAKEKYGTTHNYHQGAFMTPEGELLNFQSGKGDVYGRGRLDHEDIANITDPQRNLSRAHSLLKFMDEGNIRLHPETGKIQLLSPPSLQQKYALMKWAKNFEDKGVGVEIGYAGVTPAEKNFNRNYPPGTPPPRIFKDIEDHFAGRTAKPLSEFQRTRASLQQERGKVTKGEIEFFKNDQAVIRIFTKHADFSTILHEMAHWSRRKVMNAEEHTVVESWLKAQGVKVLDEGGKWTKEAEETYARAFERYLHDGQAPTRGVKPIFERIKTFMRDVYATAKKSVLGKEIPPEVREVFDSLLGLKKEEADRLQQEGLTPRENRAHLQKKEEASPESMKLDGPMEAGKEPPRGRPMERDPGLAGGVQQFTDPRLANPGGERVGKKGEAPIGQTPGIGTQQPLSPGLHGESFMKKPPPPKEPVPKSQNGPLFPDSFEVPSENRFDVFLRKVQDKMRPLKLTQRAITKAGRPIRESTDAYQAEELYHGRAGAALREADKSLVDPVLSSMKKSGLDLKQVDEYLYARHAKERNAQIAGINADPTKGSGMTNAEADAILGKSTPALEAIGRQVDKLNNHRLDVLESSGLISAETRKTWESTYKHYVPLRGFEDAVDTPEQIRDSHIGQGFDIRGRESQRALGRGSKADSPLSYSIAQLNEAIVRAEKNKVSKTFLKLVLDNPNHDLWTINKLTPEQSLQGGLVVRKMVVKRDDPNVVSAKVNGKEYFVQVEPKFAPLAVAMKNMGEEKAGFIVKTLGKVNKVLALVNTTLSPEFVLSNFMRDAQTAGINMTGEQGTKFAANVAKDILPAMRGALQGIRDSQFLTPSKNLETWTHWYKRFEKAGGKTEYLGLRSVEDIKNEFEAKLNKPTAWGRSKEGVKWLGTQIEDINSAVENSVRLAAFKNAVESGMSEAKAASLAKNLTVNFNRKGELGTLANSLYLFFNANVQGGARLASALAKPHTPAGKRLWGIAGGLTAASFGLAEWNRSMAGEDEDGINRYDKVAPFVKERNLVFMVPNSKGKEVQAYTIPIPYEYNVFHVAGDAMSQWMHGGDKMEGVMGIVQALASAYNPLGGESSQTPAKWLTKTATPTVADPIVDYAMNEDFTGTPIKPENLPFGTPKPESQLAFKSVSPMARAAAEWMNKQTGGSEYRSGKVDISPEALEHFVTSYTGSLGKFIYNTMGYVGGLSTGTETDLKKMPFARRFMMGENEYYDQKTFSDNTAQYKPFLEEAKNLDGEEEARYEKEFGPQIELGQMAQSIQKSVERLNKTAKRMRNADDQAGLKEIEMEKRKLFREFNGEVNRRKKAPPAVPAAAP